MGIRRSGMLDSIRLRKTRRTTGATLSSFPTCTHGLQALSFLSNPLQLRTYSVKALKVTTLSSSPHTFLGNHPSPVRHNDSRSNSVETRAGLIPPLLLTFFSSAHSQPCFRPPIFTAPSLFHRSPVQGDSKVVLGRSHNASPDHR